MGTSPASSASVSIPMMGSTTAETISSARGPWTAMSEVMAVSSNTSQS